jgi:hypothetical protein
MICDPFKSYDCSSHNLDFKMGRTRDISFFTFFMQIYVENISVMKFGIERSNEACMGFFIFYLNSFRGLRFLHHSTFQLFCTGASCGRFVFC